MNIARLRKLRGFTLIELIVVIVIMGILVAIGAFAYNAIISSSRADATTKVAGQIAKSIQAHSATNQAAYNTFAPSAAVDAADLPAGGGYTFAPLASAPGSSARVTVTNSNGTNACIQFTPTAIGTAPSAAITKAVCS